VTKKNIKSCCLWK